MRARINHDGLDAVERAQRAYQKKVERAHREYCAAIYRANVAGNGYRAIGGRLRFSGARAQQLAREFTEWATAERRRLDAPIAGLTFEAVAAEQNARDGRRRRLEKLLGESK